MSELEPNVYEVSVSLDIMRESNDKVEFKQWGILPKESGDEEWDGELNEDYNLHFYKGVPLRYWVVLLRLDLYPLWVSGFSACCCCCGMVRLPYEMVVMLLSAMSN